MTNRKHPDSQPDYSVIKSGGDPYVYPNTSVLRNLQGLRDAKELQLVESQLTAIRLAELNASTVNAPNSLQGFKALHHYIFQDIYAWAGRVRKVQIYKAEEALGGGSAPYSHPDTILKEASEALRVLNSRAWSAMNLDERAATFSKDVAELWRVHAFREGNTRTIVTFMGKFSREQDMPLDMELLRDNAAYVRRALVAASVDQPDHLTRIVKDALERGVTLPKETRKTLTLNVTRDRDLG